MSKKQSKKPKNKKVVKVKKAKVSSKKNTKPSKSSKKVVKKKTAKPAPKKAVKKAVASKKNTKTAAKKVVAKKKIAKKVVAKKPIKSAKKVVKPAKKIKKVVAKKVTTKKIKPAKVKKEKKAIKLPVAKVKIEKPTKEKKAKEVKKDTIPAPPKVSLKPSRAKSGRKPKNKGGDDDEPEVLADELIEEIIKSTKIPKKPKLPKIIKTFVNPMATLQVALPEGSGKQALPKKEPKGKFELEFVIRTSAPLLYEFISTPSGLSEWFADDVNIKDGIFTFYWDGSEQKAKLIAFKEDKFIRFQWVDRPIGTYVEFRIEKDELTGDVSLMIVDFADEGPDTESSKKLWDSQVSKLLHVLGSF